MEAAGAALHDRRARQVREARRHREQGRGDGLGPTLKVSSATPVLFVERVEPTRDFFKRAGFEVAFEVPDGDKLGFAMLARDGVQVMVETRGNSNESARVQALTKESRCAAVFIEVDDLDAVIAAMQGAKVAAERHTTFYKADEISYEEPGGNLVTFAKFAR